MKRSIVIIFLLLVFCMGCAVFVNADDFDDLRRSMKDFRRSSKLQRQQQRQQNIGRDTNRYELLQLPKTDRAATKNEERLKKLMETRRRDLSQEMDSEWSGFLKKHHLIIEFFVVALIIVFLSIMFYREKLKKIEGEK